MSYRYGAWRGGPDPLEPPFDVAKALDRLGERVLSGDRAADALRNLLRQGMPGTRGLRDLLRQARDRRRELRERGRLDGTLEQVRELLDQAVDPGAPGAVPRPVGRGAPGRGRARPAPAGHGPGRPPAGRLPVALARGRRHLRADPRPAPPRGARLPVQGDARRPGRGQPRGAPAHPGHGGRPQRHARGRRPRRGHPAPVRGVHGALRRHVPREPAQPGGAGRRPGPPGGGGQPAGRLPHPRAAGRAGRAVRVGPRRPRAPVRAGPARPLAPLPPARPVLGPGRGHGW